MQLQHPYLRVTGIVSHLCYNFQTSHDVSIQKLCRNGPGGKVLPVAMRTSGVPEKCCVSKGANQCCMTWRGERGEFQLEKSQLIQAIPGISVSETFSSASFLQPLFSDLAEVGGIKDLLPGVMVQFQLYEVSFVKIKFWSNCCK